MKFCYNWLSGFFRMLVILVSLKELLIIKFRATSSIVHAFLCITIFFHIWPCRAKNARQVKVII